MITSKHLEVFGNTMEMNNNNDNNNNDNNNNNNKNKKNVVDSAGANHNCKLFVYKQKVRGQTDDNARRNVKIMVPLKYVNNIWRTLQMLLIDCEINLILT